MTKLALIVVLALALSATVLADSIFLSVPQEGNTIDTTAQQFTFSVDSGEVISSCSMLIDGALIKTITYNEVIKGQALSTKMPLDDGLHTWRVSCEAPKTVFFSDNRTFTAKTNEAPKVTVTSSGTFRGSMLRSFTIANSQKQEPIVIEKAAPGDYLGITLSIPPSKITAELYIKQSSTLNGDRYMLLEDTKTKKDYQAFLDKNLSVSVGDSHIILLFQEFALNRATFIAYPYVKAQGSTEPAVTPEQPTTPEPEVTPTVPTETPPPETPTSEPAPAVPVQPQQGVFKRFLSWLVNLFG